MIKYFLIVFFAVLTSCNVPSRIAMNGAGGRTSYNERIQKTTNEQMLLNLVRLRYYDIPFFLDVSTITSQVTFGSKANGGLSIPGFNQDNPVSLGGEFSWQSQPTIQYTPLEGYAFASQLMQAIDLQIIQQLIFTGWDVDRLFRLLVQNIDDIHNAPEAAGPAPDGDPIYEKFYHVTFLLRKLQKEQKLVMGVSYKKAKTTDLQDPQSVSPNQYKPKELQISFPAEGETAEELSKLLKGIKLVRGRYILSLTLGYNENAEMGLLTRSLLSAMYYLSLGVEVPMCDVLANKVSAHHDSENEKWAEVSDTLMQIKYCTKYPKNAYLAVKYRNLYFYIADDDLSSKRTFVLLQQLYNLQSRDIKQQAPLLSIPLG